MRMSNPRNRFLQPTLYLVIAAFITGAWIATTMFGVGYQHVATAVVGWLAMTPRPTTATGTWQDYKPVNRTPSTCPDYDEYSQKPHPPYSSGPLALPYMRPSPECRTFNSSAMEKVITDMNDRLKDRDLAQLFSNAMGSTLDTTVKFFSPEDNLAFIITGDITAQWLRDTGNQFAHLYRLLPSDPELQSLVKAVINTEARYITQFPYCGAFQPPPESGLAPTLNGYSLLVDVNPPVDNQTVFECKYELDSLAGFLKMASRYYEQTNDDSFINDNFMDAMNTIMQVIHDQSLPAWTSDYYFVSYYNWTGLPGSSSPPVKNDGNGEPWAGNGLVRSHHRPSDDLCVYPYITGDNAMVSVELDNIAQVLESAGKMPDVVQSARNYSTTIRDAIWAHTINNGLFVYESDGYGSFSFMDDANVPGTASLAYIGFLNRSDSTYQKTKSALYSRANPYYAEGSAFNGFGGPHAFPNVWPMSLSSKIFGTDDDDEIMDALYTIMNGTSGLGLVHESVNVHNGSVFTRPWFAWANSYFAETVLDLAERKPHLIFNDATPYVAGSQ